MKIKEMLKEMFRERRGEIPDVEGVPDLETVARLISEETNQLTKSEKDEDKTYESGGSADMASEDVGPTDEETQTEKRIGDCCPYYFKRNLVESIAEVRSFAERHELASTFVKGLLTLLAEIAIKAMKGKVDSSVLMLLMNAINFEKAIENAFKDGRIAGRNDTIEERYFPDKEDGIPHFNGKKSQVNNPNDIFNIAREA